MRSALLPSLAVEDAPSAVLQRAFEAGGALVSVTGLPGAGKSVWVRQLREASQSGASPVRWRAVSVLVDESERDVPYALAGRLLRAAGRPGNAAGVMGDEGSGGEESGPEREAPASGSELLVTARARR